MSNLEPIDIHNIPAIRARHIPVWDVELGLQVCKADGTLWRENGCDTAIVLAALDEQEFHDDGDECTGLSCGNPGHGWNAAIEREARLRAAVEASMNDLGLGTDERVHRAWVRLDRALNATTPEGE